MLKVTLDTNCIIDLEENRVNAGYLKELISKHNGKFISLQVPGIGASERRKIGGYSQSYTDFKTKLKNAGLEGVEILAPPGRFDITFWDHCIFIDKEMEELEQRIHEILFAEIPFSFEDFCKQNGIEHDIYAEKLKWRNAKCDVLALWCHMHYGGDIFITSDRNFHKSTKKPSLLQLGAKNICYPFEAVEIINLL